MLKKMKTCKNRGVFSAMHAESSLLESHRIGTIKRLFCWEEAPIEFLFSHKRRELRLPAKELKREARGFSEGERVLVHAALDFWSGAGKTSLFDAISILDHDHFLNLMGACLYFREISPDELHSTWMQIENGFARMPSKIAVPRDDIP